MNTKFRFLFTCFFLFILTEQATAQVDLPKLVKKVQPAVVTIITYGRNKKVLKQGSGFFINAKGHIITNSHVLKGAYEANVITYDGNRYPIKFVTAQNAVLDLLKALVDIPEKSHSWINNIGAIPEVAERVIVIGSPMGLDQTVTEGIVSAVRETPAIGKFFQISAPISAGSSGSPVINTKGEVIGIATFQMVEGQNLNFAIPAKQILALKQEEPLKTISEWTHYSSKTKLETAEELLRKGSLLEDIGEYKKALPFFIKATKASPDYAMAWLALGNCYGELGKFNDAISAYGQALKTKPESTLEYAVAYHNMGFSYMELGQYKYAIKALKRAIEIKPDYIEAYIHLGIAYGKLGYHSDSIIAYKQAIRLKPDLAMAYKNLGNAYMHFGRYDDAITPLKQAILIDPFYANAYSDLGQCYAESNLPHKAIEVLKQAIRIKPDDFFAHRNLGFAYAKLRRPEDAIKAYKQAIKIKPDDAYAHLGLGLMYFMNGDKFAALEEYRILEGLDRKIAERLYSFISK